MGSSPQGPVPELRRPQAPGPTELAESSRQPRGGPRGGQCQLGVAEPGPTPSCTLALILRSSALPESKKETCLHHTTRPHPTGQRGEGIKKRCTFTDT